MRGSSRNHGALPVWQAGPEAREPGAALCATLVERLAAAGLDVLYVDFTSPRMRALGVHVVKAIVPGLEVETLSYYRIGERNARKLLAGGSSLVGREPGPGRLPIRLLAAAEERLGGPAYLDTYAVDRLVGRLYPLYREPDVHVAPLARARVR